MPPSANGWELQLSNPAVTMHGNNGQLQWGLLHGGDLRFGPDNSTAAWTSDWSDPETHLSYVIGKRLTDTLPATGTLNYALSGATPVMSSNPSDAPGILNRFNLDIHLASAAVTADIQLTVPNVVPTATPMVYEGRTGSTPLAMFDWSAAHGTFFFGLDSSTVSASTDPGLHGCPPGDDCGLNVQGFLTGAQGAHAGLTYALTHRDMNGGLLRALHGAAALGPPPSMGLGH